MKSKLKEMSEKQIQTGDLVKLKGDPPEAGPWTVTHVVPPGQGYDCLRVSVARTSRKGSLETICRDVRCWERIEPQPH